LFYCRFITSLICSSLRLSLPLFLTSLYYLFNVSNVSSYVCYVTIPSLQSVFICLLRHCSVLCSDCLFLCFLGHYSISSRFPMFHYLFVTSLLYSRFRRSPPVHFFCYVTILSLQGFYCFIICLLRQCSVLAFYYPFLGLLRVTFYSGYFYVINHYTIVLRIPLFYYLLITSLICSRLRLSLLLFVTSVYYLFKVSIGSLFVT